jgi:hypothetical protein
MSAIKTRRNTAAEQLNGPKWRRALLTSHCLAYHFITWLVPSDIVAAHKTAIPKGGEIAKDRGKKKAKECRGSPMIDKKRRKDE